MTKLRKSYFEIYKRLRAVSTETQTQFDDSKRVCTCQLTEQISLLTRCFVEQLCCSCKYHRSLCLLMHQICKIMDKHHLTPSSQNICKQKLHNRWRQKNKFSSFFQNYVLNCFDCFCVDVSIKKKICQQNLAELTIFAVIMEDVSKVHLAAMESSTVLLEKMKDFVVSE